MEQRVRPYKLIEGELFKGVYTPLLKCLSHAKDQELMKEIHACTTGSHIGSRILLEKVLQKGFYWPKVAIDVEELVWRSDNCCKKSKEPIIPHLANLTNMDATKMGHGHHWTNDTSTKKFEICGGNNGILYQAKALATKTLTSIQKIYWQNIICYFSIPKALTGDNGTQFHFEAFRLFYDQLEQPCTSLM